MSDSEDQIPEETTQQEERGISYDPSSLPHPTTGKEQYLQALLVEARLIRKTLQSLDRSMKLQTRTAQEQARAVKKATR